LNDTGDDASLFGKLYGIIESSSPVPSVRNLHDYAASTKFSEIRDICATLRGLHHHNPGCVTDEVGEEFMRQQSGCYVTFNRFIEVEMRRRAHQVTEDGKAQDPLRCEIYAAIEFDNEDRDLDIEEYDFFGRKVESMRRVVKAAEKNAGIIPVPPRRAMLPREGPKK